METENKPPFTYRQLKEAVNAMNDEQLDNDIIAWGEERGVKIEGLFLLEEEYIHTDEGDCPRSTFNEEDLADYEDEPRMPSGRPVLHFD